MSGSKRIAVVSILVNAGEGSQIEIGTLVDEGAVGFALNPAKAIGANAVQVGEAMRMAVGPFDQRLRTNTLLHKLIHRYIYALMHQIIQAGACNQLRTVEERLRKMATYRTGTDTFQLTQEHLSAAGVSERGDSRVQTSGGHPGLGLSALFGGAKLQP